jgi:hypothetical protein
MQFAGKLLLVDLPPDTEGDTTLFGSILVNKNDPITAKELAHEFYHLIQMHTIMSNVDSGAAVAGFPVGTGFVVWGLTRSHNAFVALRRGTPGFGPLDIEADEFADKIVGECKIP